MKFKTAKCERTGNEVLLSDGYFVAETDKGEWFFVSIDAPERHGDYNISVSSLTKSPEALIDWLAHLEDKTWFNSNKFVSFFSRLRANNNLFNSL